MRLVLTVEAGALAGREFVLDGGALHLGRDESCQVRFPAGDTQVSRQHAVIQSADGGFVIVDRRSTNGTRVNAARVDSARLQDGDLIELGAGGPQVRVAVVPGDGASRTRAPARAAATLVERALYDPTRDRGRRYGWGGVALVVGMIGLGAGLGMLVALLTAFELGLGIALVGVVVAFAPAAVYLALWLWLDRYDPEPAWALAGCLVWGAGAATFVSSLFNSVFGAAMQSLTGDAGLSDFLSASISAPFVEEATKGFAVLLVFLLLRREFDGIIDGIVYAGVVALGFATVENVLYYGRVAAKEGAGALVALFILRGVLGPFGHAVYTAMIGIGFGVARQSHHALVRVAAPAGGYAAAVVLHSLWNALAGLSPGPLAFLAIYALVWFPLFLAFCAFLLYMGHRESRLIRRMLAPEVERGVLSAEHAETVASWPRRVWWLLSALGDRARLGARRRFLQAASRLALSYWHVERAAATGGMTLSVRRVPVFRAEVERLRGQV